MLYSIFSRGCDLHMEKCDNFYFREFISACVHARLTQLQQLQLEEPAAKAANFSAPAP
jgi:organic radical activating enzyme